MNTSDVVRHNLASVQQRILAAAERSGRDPASVRMVAVTKYASLDEVRALIELGVTALGESRSQQLTDRAALFSEPLEWHLIGTLQRNKARRVLPVVALIHSVDSLRLLERLESLAAETGHRPRLLLQVDSSSTGERHGFTPDELLAAADRLQQLQAVRLDGLMTMAPQAAEEVVRGAFRGLRLLRDQLANRLQGQWPLRELSMGMSGDFDIAIEEGATIVRIGRGLFRHDEMPASPATESATKTDTGPQPDTGD